MRRWIRRLQHFRCLSAADRRLLMATLVWLWVIRLSLWLLPLQTLRRLLARMARPVAGCAAEDPAAVARVAWAVPLMARGVPAATCLPQALAGQLVLARYYGLPTRMRIGVARDPSGTFEAHAWIECQGRVVTGDLPDLDRFTPLPPLETVPHVVCLEREVRGSRIEV